MPDNIPLHIYIATHLAAAICTQSVQTHDLTNEAVNRTARDAVNVFHAVNNAVKEALGKTAQ